MVLLIMFLTSPHSFTYYVHNKYASGIQAIGFESLLLLFDRLTFVVTLVLIQKRREATAEWVIVTQIKEPKNLLILSQIWNWYLFLFFQEPCNRSLVLIVMYILPFQKEYEDGLNLHPSI